MCVFSSHCTCSVIGRRGQIKTDTKLVMDVFTLLRCHSCYFLCCFFLYFSLPHLLLWTWWEWPLSQQLHHLFKWFTWTFVFIHTICWPSLVSSDTFYRIFFLSATFTRVSDYIQLWSSDTFFSHFNGCFLLPLTIRWHLWRCFVVISGKYIVWSVDEHEIKARDETTSMQVRRRKKERVGEREMRKKERKMNNDWPDTRPLNGARGAS